MLSEALDQGTARIDLSDAYRRLSSDVNDAEAWVAVERVVHGWAQAALRDFGRAAVEDAVVDTCSRVAVDFDRARGPETFRGFVLGIFLNVRRSVLHSHPADVTLPDYVDIASSEPDDGPDPDELWRLEVGLAALPPRERRAVLMRYFEERTAAEIATDLLVTEVHARRIVCNGLARLRRLFAAYRDGASGLYETTAVR